MRDIKFRAWDTNSKKMFDYSKIQDYSLEQVERLNSANDPYTKFMQYTTLKDKNGIEIYEGDIILWYGGALKHIPIYSEVKWNREEARFSFGCKANSAYMFYNTEVVGNIYENPDLLKG